MGILEGGDGTSLDQELINTNQTANVAYWEYRVRKQILKSKDDIQLTARDIFNGLDETTHHEHGTLDSLLVQVSLVAGHVVRAHDTSLHASADLAREDTSEGVETTLIGGWYHFGNVHHERAVGVAVLHGDSGFIIQRTFVQHLCTVFLGHSR